MHHYMSGHHAVEWVRNSIFRTESKQRKKESTSIQWVNTSYKVPKMKTVGLANSVDPDEMAQVEPPHLNLLFVCP